MAIFKGAGVAIVTPMYDNEEVNYDKLEELINMQIDNGTDAIIIAGTTGESPCLSMEEHAKVIKAAVEFTKHRVPVVAGTGSNCTKTAMQLSKEAEEFGADGLLVVTPYYNKATQAGLVSHYSQIADSTKCPIIVYNVPGRTGCNVLPETMAELFKTKENIVGLKEATGNLAQASKTMYLTDGKLDMYSGEDSRSASYVYRSNRCNLSMEQCSPCKGTQYVRQLLQGRFTDSLRASERGSSTCGRTLLRGKSNSCKEGYEPDGYECRTS